MPNVLNDIMNAQNGERRFYFGLLPSTILKQVTFVPVTEASSKNYVNEAVSIDAHYQRPGSATRQRKFRKFLLDNPSSVVPPIVISTRDQWVFTGDGSIGQLEITGPAAIIDGQHRAGGYIALYEDNEEERLVPFIALPDLTLDEEKAEFLTINTNQQSVSASLQTFLDDSDESTIAWALNENDDSIFKGRISLNKKTRHHLFSLNAVAKHVTRAFDNGKIEDLSVDDKVDILNKYWQAVADALPEEWADINKLDDNGCRGRSDFYYKLLETTGLIAWSHIAPQILSRTYQDDFGVSWDQAKHLIESAAAVDWEKDGQYGGMTGEYGGRIIATDMERMLPAEAGGDDSD
jgi:DNA sulfur modification protein DndB